MKTLLAFTAAAAMVAGISIASAQTSMDKNSSGTMGHSSMSGSPSTKGTGAFCITGSSGATNCTFASIAACQKVAKSGEKCTPNQNSATTGAK